MFRATFTLFKNIATILSLDSWVLMTHQPSWDTQSYPCGRTAMILFNQNWGIGGFL